MYKDADDEDGDLPEGVPVEERVEGSMPGRIVIETQEKAPRDFYIRKEDAELHGYTRGCEGCSSWFKGLGRQKHSDECRERIRELLKSLPSKDQRKSALPPPNKSTELQCCKTAERSCRTSMMVRPSVAHSSTNFISAASVV